jgi:hypothetical protein
MEYRSPQEIISERKKSASRLGNSQGLNQKAKMSLGAGIISSLESLLFLQVGNQKARYRSGTENRKVIAIG